MKRPFFSAGVFRKARSETDDESGSSEGEEDRTEQRLPSGNPLPRFVGSALFDLWRSKRKHRRGRNAQMKESNKEKNRTEWLARWNSKIYLYLEAQLIGSQFLRWNSW